MVDRCTTSDCLNPAVAVVSCENEGYYPYCRGCAEILLLGGETLHPDSPAPSDTVTLRREQFDRLDKLADWIERDCREPDKVFAYAQDLRSTLYAPQSVASKETEPS